MRFGSRTIFILMSVAAVACSQVPGYVIPPDDMAAIMADMHTAETVAENNYSNYASDSAKMLLKQSVVEHNGYTLQQLDTSFMWYGAHLKEYTEVYDKTISIIEERIAANRADMQQKYQLLEGDSIDMWLSPGSLLVRSASPSAVLPFSYQADENWSIGDVFTFRAKFSGVTGTPELTMNILYDDLTFEVLSKKFSADGWQEITFFADTLKSTASVNGAIDFDVKRGTMVIDSIQFIRRPKDSRRYSQRYRQKTYDLKHKKNAPDPKTARLSNENGALDRAEDTELNVKNEDSE